MDDCRPVCISTYPLNNLVVIIFLLWDHGTTVPEHVKSYLIQPSKLHFGTPAPLAVKLKRKKQLYHHFVKF